ncbi:MAG: hypothetical protein LBQ12_11835 [Deltaproteobacteria bacterium]|nr:hypothetical protein [Deltaproteobacteria bacterium]
MSGQHRVRLSARVKTCVLAHYGFEAGCRVFCTELSVPGGGANIADVAVLDADGRVIEIEVKTTLADLRRDFKKPKHFGYLRSGAKGAFAPDAFFFAVPDTMDLEKAVKAVGELDGSGKYGVMAVTLPLPAGDGREPLWFSGSGAGAVRIVKPAGRLRERDGAGPELRPVIVRRLLAELVNQRYLTETFYPALADGGSPGRPAAGGPQGASGRPSRKAAGKKAGRCWTEPGMKAGGSGPKLGKKSRGSGPELGKKSGGSGPELGKKADGGGSTGSGTASGRGAAGAGGPGRMALERLAEPSGSFAPPTANGKTASAEGRLGRRGGKPRSRPGGAGG